MNIRTAFLFTIVLFVALFCKGATNVVAGSFYSLSNDAVLVRIDGKQLLTKDDVQNDLMVNLQLRCNTTNRHKANKADLQFAKWFRRSAQERFVTEAVIARYAEQHGIKAAEAHVKATTRDIVRRFRRGRQKIADLKWMLGKNIPRLDKMIYNKALHDTVDEELMREPRFEVTPQMISNRIDIVRQCNVIASLTNSLVFAHATNVYETVKAGLKFEDAAKKYSEDEYIDEGCEWGTFTLQQLADEQDVFLAVCALKPGEYAPPMESDGGLAIIRRDSTNFVDGAGQKCCTLSRIFFRLPLFYEMPTAEETVKLLMQEEHERRWKDAFDRTKAAMKIEYPNGTNLFERVSN